MQVRARFFKKPLTPHDMNTVALQLDRFLRRKPKLGRGVYLAKTATVIGDVTLGAHSSVWYGAVLRGDINRIVVGHHTNIQDNAVLHLADDYACILGNWVTVGHGAIVHACTLKNRAFVAMGATIMDGSVIEEGGMLGAGALLPPGKTIGPNELWLGSPARLKRVMTPEERAGWDNTAIHYAELAARFRAGLRPAG